MPGVAAVDDGDDGTLSSLRFRLQSLKDAFGEQEFDEAVSQEEQEAAQRKRRAAMRRKGNCLDTLIDGSFMGAVFLVCLVSVVGAGFFAYRNLFHAVMRKMYPIRDEL